MKTYLFFTILFLTVHFTFSQWTQQGVDIDGEAANDRSGTSVSLSADGSILAIGAYQNDGNGNDSGHVRVYQWDGINWSQLGQDIDGEAIHDWSGESVSLSADGSILAIGAIGNDGNGSSSGHVRVYQWDGLNWSQLGQDIDGEAANDFSGQSVSLSADGSILAIGASGNDENGSSSGHVRVYQWDGLNWNQLGVDINGEAASDQSGISISLSTDGSILAIGAFRNDGNGNESGHVRVYQWDGLNWSQIGQDIDGKAADDRSGRSVSLSADGSILAIGAPYNDGNGLYSGYVQVYQWNGLSWVQLGADISGEVANDWSGWSVNLSADGSILAIGGPYSNTNGSASGHVRVYQWDGMTWNQSGTEISGAAPGDQSGTSVSLSADGSILAIGAPENDDNGNNSGHVRVYTNPGINSPYTAIPDASFEQALINQGIDSEGILDGQVLTEDISGLTTLNVANTNIADLSGIEDFMALETLYCEFNTLSSLNVNQNINLSFLSCYNNQITALDLTQNPGLTELYCQNNQLVSLMVDGLSSLTGFNAGGNPGLLCIRVSNVPDANAGIGIYAAWVKDDTASYSENCFADPQGNTWIQQGSDLDGEAADDQSGYSVSLSADGNVVAIGAPDNDGNDTAPGYVRVYQWNGMAWNQLGTDLEGEAVGDESGTSVSLSADGSIVAIGAPDNDDNGGNSGHVRVYQWDGMNWSQLGQDLDGEAANDGSGSSVSLSADGSILAIGALSNDANGVNSGHVRVYQWDGLNWSQLGQDLDGEATYDRFGWSVSLSTDGSILAIGAAYNDGNGNLSGHVRVYQWDGMIWNQIGADINGEAANDRSGTSVSLSADGSVVAIGAIWNEENGSYSGHVRVYQWDGMIWNQIGADLDAEAAGDNSGHSVSLSADGSILAIGARHNDGNGFESGHVRVYRWNGVSWVQSGADIDGEAAGDESGWSVSLSADGSMVAIGAPENEENGSDSGHVRVYSYSDPYTAIPDANFEQALIDQGIDSEGIPDGQVLTTAISGITHLNIANNNIADLSGIEDFTALQVLYANDNQLTALDVTQNPNLTHLYVERNALTALDVTQNPNLMVLYCHQNQIATLDASQNTNLTHLYCYVNQLTSLDVPATTTLTQLRCQNNQLTALDVTQNSGLIQLYANDNQIGSLDVTQASNLTHLYVERNALTALDVTQNPNLVVLYCHQNQIATLDASQNTNLTHLYCYVNQLTSLAVPATATLTHLRCQNNQLTTLDVTQNSGLIQLYANDNQIGSLDVTQASNLTHLYVERNALTALDVTQNPDLVVLYCHQNQIATLDASQNTSLTHLYCYVNQLTSLDVPATATLTHLRCQNNQLTTLDVTQNSGLIQLYANDNQIGSLDVTQASNLTHLYVERNALTALDVTQNPDLVVLYCHQNQIATLDASQNTSLTHLYCYVNQLTSLDVPATATLTHLRCQNNQLTGSLLLSGTTSLTNLNATNNSGLVCIEVTNATDADAGIGIYAGWIKDVATLYSEDCGMMARSTGVSDIKDTQNIGEETSLTVRNIILYPNPAKEQLHIALPGEKELATVTLYNVQGQQVVQTKSNMIHTAQLSAGIYLAAIELKDGTRLTKKVMISNE